MQNSLTTKKAKNKAGVTLIELLVVIMIVVTVMAISIPAFTSMGRGAGMRGAVSAVTSTLALSRQWAITKREPVQFYWGADTTGAYFEVTAITNDADNTGITIQHNYLGVGLGFTASDSIIFRTDGSLDASTVGGFSSSIVITSVDAQSRTTVVNQLTGAITVQ